MKCLNKVYLKHFLQEVTEKDTPKQNTHLKYESEEALVI